jgi:hypothetical protein
VYLTECETFVLGQRVVSATSNSKAERPQLVDLSENPLHNAHSTWWKWEMHSLWLESRDGRNLFVDGEILLQRMVEKYGERVD